MGGFSRNSAADLSAKKYFIAMNDANGKAVLADAATKGLLGVIKDGGRSSGDDVSIYGPDEIAEVIAGGAITLSATLPIYVTSDAAGKAVATTTAGNIVIGIALTTAATDDKVQILPTYFRHP